LTLSRTTSIVLLVFYLPYLYFRSATHAELFREEEDVPEDKLHPLASSIVLIGATLGVVFCSDCLVDSADGFVEALSSLRVSRAFIGLIIVPIVGNAGCFVGTVQWSRTNRINVIMTKELVDLALTAVVQSVIVVGKVIGKNTSL